MNESKFIQAARERVLVFDGAAGTCIQGADLTLKDYEGHPEFLAEVCTFDRYFLMTEVLHRRDAQHPWIYDRCRMVEKETDDCLDLWARGHFKSSIITNAGTFPEIIKNREKTWG